MLSSKFPNMAQWGRIKNDLISLPSSPTFFHPSFQSPSFSSCCYFPPQLPLLHHAFLSCPYSFSDVDSIIFGSKTTMTIFIPTMHLLSFVNLCHQILVSLAHIQPHRRASFHMQASSPCLCHTSNVVGKTNQNKIKWPNIVWHGSINYLI